MSISAPSAYTHRQTPPSPLDSFPKGEREGEILKTERRYTPMMGREQILIQSRRKRPGSTSYERGFGMGFVLCNSQT